MQDHDTDAVMKNLWRCMVEDFRSVYGPEYKRKEEILLLTDVKRYRQISWPSRSTVNPYLYKVEAQLESLFGRYTFADDVFTQKQLEQMSFQKFQDTQMRIQQRVPEGLTAHLVLQKARAIVKDVLGDFDMEEHLRACRFGKRASYGVLGQDSYLDVKLECPVSGTADHIAWFEKTVLISDRLLGDAILQRTDVPKYHVCDHLNYGLVPKKWNALRGIMPNTTIGSYYTYGLGKMIAARLKEKIGIDISRQQNRHRKWIKEMSLDRKHVTADLSAASDSFTTAILTRLVPRQWLNKLKFGRASHYRYKGKKYYLNSFMTMGNGYTFPLQTLLFYALIKAIGDLAGVKGIYSVYGDDLIYPRRIHRYVESILPKLGFILNADKTFCTDHFRESCGLDYFRGVEVRSFRPEGVASQLSSWNFTSYLYKLLNGLAQRWNYDELPQTFQYLFAEVLDHAGRIYHVPPDYPDYSGWKGRIVADLAEYTDTRKYDKYKQQFTFQYIREVAPLRRAPRQIPYYWDVMRSSGGEKPDVFNEFKETLDRRRFLIFIRDESLDKVMPNEYFDDGPTPPLIWRASKRLPRIRLQNGKRVRQKEPYVAVKLRTKCLVQTGVTSVAY